MELIMLKDKMNQLLEQEMDRKDFLKHVGITVIALSGATAVFKALSTNPQKSSTNAPKSMGYGSSAYGGKKVG